MITNKHPLFLLILVIGLLLVSGQPTRATDDVTSICPTVGIQERGADFQPGGIILTTFDKSAIWVYNIDNGRRYPLPETAPCGHNCTLSPDATWLTYFNDPTNTFNRMRLDGTERALVAENAAEVSWWSADTLSDLDAGQTRLPSASWQRRRAITSTSKA